MVLPDKIVPISKLDTLDISKVVDKNNILLLATAPTVDYPVPHSVNLPYTALISDMSVIVNNILSPYVYNLEKIPNILLAIDEINKKIDNINNNFMPEVMYSIQAINQRIDTLEDRLVALELIVEKCCGGKK